MDQRTLKQLVKRAASCKCPSCLLKKAREMLLVQESLDQSLGVAVRILEDLMRSGSGIAVTAFPLLMSSSWNLSGRASGVRPQDRPHGDCLIDGCWCRDTYDNNDGFDDY